MGKLQEQMKADLLLKRYSPHTTRAYVRMHLQLRQAFHAPALRDGRNRGAPVYPSSRPGSQSLFSKNDSKRCLELKISKRCLELCHLLVEIMRPNSIENYNETFSMV